MDISIPKFLRIQCRQPENRKITRLSPTISTTRMEHALTDDNSEPTIVQRSIAEGISHRDELIGNDKVVEDQHHLPDMKKRTFMKIQCTIIVTTVIKLYMV